jgi:predicted metalloendopeptidase
MESESTECEETNLTGADIRPQDDYYGYVNQETLFGLTVTSADSGAGVPYEMDEAVSEELYTMIREIADSKEAYALGSNEQIVHDFDEQLVAYIKDRKSGAKEQFLEVVAQIEGVQTLADVEDTIGALQEQGILSYFNVGVGQNYYDGESYALYLDQEMQFTVVSLKDFYEQEDERRSLRNFAVNVLVAAGEEPEDAKTKADDLVYFLLDVACATDFSIMEAANPYTTFQFRTNEEMNKILEGITVEELENICGIQNPYGGWMIQDEEQLQCLSSHFNEENVEVLKTWMLCEVAISWKDFLQEDYPFLETYGVGYDQEAEQMAASLIGDILPNQISELYAKQYYTEEMDEQIHRMYDDIIDGYRQLIREADWLTEETRDGLLRKLESMYFVAGGGTPHEIDAEDAKLIGEDAFGTYVNIAKWNIQKEREEIGQKIDKTESVMSSQDVNSAYSPSNTFTITVAIMHAPYFDVNAAYASNLGGLGMVMAHEIGHAFDSTCIAFDENGTYRPEWICEEDQAKLSQRLTQMENYYSGYTIMEIYHVDGAKTSGENYADKGAMECLMKIVQSPGERELLFENYAYIWCELVEDSLVIRQLQEDVHSPNETRVNAVLSSTDEFYEVYDVTPEDGMYVAPDDRVSRW